MHIFELSSSRAFRSVIGGALFLSLVVFAGPSVFAGDVSGLSVEKLAQVVQGGLLYDKWYGELDVKPPRQTHRLYTSQGKQKGAGTWRCKECHGWDYLGKDGAYKSGSHFSGIVGMRNSAGGSEAKVVELLKGDHAYGGKIPEDGLKALAAFVVHGQTDAKAHIDYSNKMAMGNTNAGGRLYVTVCARCHGMDGRKINFGDKEKPVYLGAVANGNPQETLHKIRIGQPGKDMVSMLGLDEADAVNVLKYSQGLPTK